MARPYIPLFAFAYHPASSWAEIASVTKDEPWGKGYKILELYLRANFEIAKTQSKVFEDKEKNIAFWRAGNLVNETSDPIWLVYRKNSRDDPYWAFDKVWTGNAPDGSDSAQWALRYEPPEFNRSWSIHFEQNTIRHILKDSENRQRLEQVFRDAFGGEFNEHLAFRAIYGEILLKHKEEVVLPQWYRSEYQFLMPLHLTQPDKVELTAALQPDPPLKRYLVRTLLLPHFSYAWARALVKSRANFADWMMLSDDELNRTVVADDDSDLDQS